MSLVGTRPILPDELEQYELHHRARIAIKPGITGMWQVSGRSDITDFEEIVRLDTEYASAATNSHPDVIQISDRFHLIKGLSEVICKYIFREFPARVEIPLTESITDEMKALYKK